MNELPLVLGLVLLLAILLRLDVLFYVVYVGVGSFVLARWWTDRNLAGLRIQRRYAERLFLGQDAQVEIEVENTRRWPVPWLRLEETVPANLVVDPHVRQVVALRPRERLRHTYEITGRRRGYYPVGPLILGTGDVFGFAQAQGRVATDDHVIVYPRVIPLARAAFQSRVPYGTIKSRQRIFADPNRVSGKRDYQPGDPLRTIDWKSSAHSGLLQVKKYDPAVSLASVIFLNLRVQEYTPRLQSQASEWAIVVAASLANYLAGQRQSVGLASNGRDSLTGACDWLIAPHGGREHLMKLLEWLARVELVENALPFAGWLPSAAAGVSWGTLALVVTPTGDEGTCQAVHRLVRAGLNPLLLIVEPHGRLGPVAERARRLGFSAALAADERDLQVL